MGGSDCPCDECDGRCAPPDDSGFPDDGEPDDNGPDVGSPDDEPDGGGHGDGPDDESDDGGHGGGPDEGPGDGGSDDDAPGGGSGGGRPGGSGDDGGPGHGGPQGGSEPPAADGSGHEAGPGPEPARPAPRSPFPTPAGGPPPTLTDLILPLATLLGQAERPGEGHNLGTLDPALCRALAATAVLSPHTSVCVTVTDPDGIAIGHGCATTSRLARPPDGPAPPLVALPALINLTITTANLTQPRAHPAAGPSGPPGPPGTGWALARHDAGPPTRSPARARGTTATRKPQRPPGDPDWCGPWTLTLPGGLQLTVNLAPVPTYDCDHRNESHAYKPNKTLRHLVQIRDHACTFPPCSRHARESDFEHAIPYDQGGRTCACNAGARSRKCHRVKQSPGWNVTQPQPGWHQWTTPRGRTYTQGPKRYPV